MRAGDVLAERFHVEKLAGSGGMGAVYRARDARDDRAVAIKVLHGQRGEHMARFAREIEVLASLDDPAVVRYVDHGLTPEGEGFLAMEWLEGVSLAERLSAEPLSFADTLTLGLRLASALGCAHRSGIVHRDVKPGNVVLVGGEVARATLVDFGIARVLDRTLLTATGTTLGTVGYMAPEQARAEGEIDARADVYALGAVLFRAVAGRAPFEGSQPLAVLVEQATKEAPRLSTFVPEAPAALDAVVAWMLRKARAERPAHGDEALAALRAIALPARSIDDAPAPESPPSRRLGAKIAGAAVVAVAATAAIVLMRGRRTPRDEAVSSAAGGCWGIKCAAITFPDPMHVDPYDVLPQATRLAQSIDPGATLCEIDGVGKDGAAILANGVLGFLSIRFSRTDGGAVEILAQPAQLVALPTSCTKTAAPPACSARAAYRAAGGPKGMTLLSYHAEERSGASLWEFQNAAGFEAKVDARTCRKR